MGLRFRKSFKVAPGVKVNLNKKSTSVTFGGKGVHHTVSSSGKKTTTVGIPGTGISYSETSGTEKNSKSTEQREPVKARKKIFEKDAYYVETSHGREKVYMDERYRHNSEESPDAPNRNKKDWRKIALIVFLSIAGLTWVAALFSDPLVSSITLNSKDIVMDINSSEKLNFKFAPDDGTSEDMEVVISKDKILSTDDKISTSKNSFTIYSGKKTGIVTLYIKDNRGDVSSNKIKVKVEDKAAIKKAKEEAKRKAEEEKKKKEEAAKKKAEAEAAKKKAEEEAKRKAEAAATESQEEMVWVPNTGSKYHSNPNCSNMDNPREEPISEAKSEGFTPCKKCY